MFWLAVVGVLFLLAGTIFTGLVRISTINYGVVTLFGERTGRIVREGLRLIWPFGFNKVELIPFDLKTNEITVIVYSKDNVAITIKGSNQHRPTGYKVPQAKTGIAEIDQKIDLLEQYPYGWAKRGDGKPLLFSYMEAEEATILGGLSDGIKHEIGAIAGTYPADKFIQERDALGRIINATLIMEVPPHKRKQLIKKFEHLPESERLVPVKDRIKFYKDHAAEIDDLIEKARNNNLEVSEIEGRYGIEIETFALATVDFSEKTKAALELARQQEAENKKVVKRTDAKATSFKTLKDAGLSSSEANDASNVILQITNPINVNDIRGGAFPHINVTPKGGP